MVSSVAPTFSSTARMSHGDRGFEEGDLLVGRTQDLRGVRTEVTTEDLLIHGPEVHRVLKVPRRVEAGQAGLGAVEAALDRVADQKQRRRGAMVGATARVFLGSPPEL